jgi:hypothetical protein
MLKLNDSIWGAGTTQVLGSAVSGPFAAVTATGESAVEGDAPPDMEVFGAPGIVFRPRAPERTTGSDGESSEIGAEAQTQQYGDRVVAFAWRDLRFNRVYPAPKPGTVALVGYGGGFVSFDDVPVGSRQASMFTSYVPYAFNSSGVASKAMAIVMDPAQETIALIHGDGAAVVIGPDGITARADGSTWVTLGPGRCSIVAASIQLRGVVAVGAQSEAGVPFTGGPSMLPCASLFLSPV